MIPEQYLPEPADDGKNAVPPLRPQRSTCRRIPSVSWHNFGGIDDFETGRTNRDAPISASPNSTANNYGPPYGSAEENFGRWTAADFRLYRDELIISTKVATTWPGPYGNRVDLLAEPRPESERMDETSTSSIPTGSTHHSARGQTMGALVHAHRQGKTRYVGIPSDSARS